MMNENQNEMSLKRKTYGVFYVEYDTSTFNGKWNKLILFIENSLECDLNYNEATFYEE